MNISQDIIRDLSLSANLIRNDVLDMLKFAGSGHLGGSFSAAEILSVLFNHELKIDASNANWSERDRFILSKGHGNPGLYAILCQKGFFSKDEYQKLRKINVSKGLLKSEVIKIYKNYFQHKNIKKPYVADAIDAMLAGNTIKYASTKALGCGIKFKN